MRDRSDMLVLVISLLYWTQAEDICTGPQVSVSDNQVLTVGEDFTLSCDFTCLTTKHVAQLWKSNSHKDKESLVNITSILPNVTVVMNVQSATKAVTGNYTCMTQPPIAISPPVSIRIVDNLTRKLAKTTTTPVTTKSDSTHQLSQTPGLQGQMWYWMLLGKTAILLLILASIAVKYNRG